MKRLTIAVLLFTITSYAFAGNMSYNDIKTCYLSSYQHEKQIKYKEAINDLKNVYKEYPETYTINFRLGWLYYLNNNYANALEHLIKAVSLQPASLEALNTIVLVHVSKADWLKVEQGSMSSIKIDYYNITANYWYSYALKMQGKYDLAIKVDQKMLAIYPTSIVFLQEMGENLFLINKKEESKNVFSNLKILCPINEVADYYLKKMGL